MVERKSADSADRAEARPGSFLAKPASDVASHELPEFILQYQQDQIAFADQKAGFTFVATGALAAYMDGKGVLHALDATSNFWTLRAWLGLAAFLMLVAASLAAVTVVVPRRKHRLPTGILFSDGIRAHPDASAYAEAVERLTDVSARTEILRHAYLLAGVTQRKYGALNLAIRMGALGVLFTAFYLLIQ